MNIVQRTVTLLLALLIILVLTGCATTKTKRSFINPETGETVVIEEERKELTEGGILIGKYATKAAWKLLQYTTEARKNEAEMKNANNPMSRALNGWQAQRKAGTAAKWAERLEDAGGGDALSPTLSAIVNGVLGSQE